MRLGELARALDCRLAGDPELEIRGVASLHTAGAGDLSFVADSQHRAAAAQTRASFLLVDNDFPVAGLDSIQGWLQAENPQVAMAEAVRLLRPERRPAAGIDPRAVVHPSASLGANCFVGAFVVIGAGCRLGAEAVIHPHAVLYPEVVAGDRLTVHAHAVVREGTRLGDDVILQPGAVIGGDGFGFARTREGGYVKIPQRGTVELGDRVEVQSNACIDRGSLDATRIGRGVKIDNLVQVAHNCEIEEDVVLCSQVGVAGSTRIGAGAILAGQAGVAGHCTIGPGAIVTAQSGTHGDLEGGRMYSGSPAFDHAQWLRATAVFARLSDLQREIRQLRHDVSQLRGEKD